MKNPSLFFHQCTITEQWRISGNIVILNNGCLEDSYPATSGKEGLQDYKNQAEYGGILPCNKELQFPCYRVSTVASIVNGISGKVFSIRPSKVTIFGQQREINYIHCDIKAKEYPNSIVLITENPYMGNFVKTMNDIKGFGYLSIPLVISYSRFGGVKI